MHKTETELNSCPDLHGPVYPTVPHGERQTGGPHHEPRPLRSRQELYAQPIYYVLYSSQ